MKKELLDNCAALVDALNEHGEVKAIGGAVFKGHGEPLMNTTDMYHAVRELAGMGVSIQRVDSGGNPTWRLA